MSLELKTLLNRALLVSSVASLLALSSCAPSPRAAVQAAGEGIIGGTDVAPNDPIASMTGILVDGVNSKMCTVSVLSARWMVTAAHCVYGKDPRTLIVGFAPSLEDLVKPEYKPMRRFVASGIVHPRFVQTQRAIVELVKKAKAEGREFGLEELHKITDWGDIALIQITEDVPAGIRPAELLPSVSMLQKGQSAVLAGYGRVSGDSSASSGALKRVNVDIEEPMRGTTEVLFDQRQGKGACKGDSGGPAYLQIDGHSYLFGVTSHGVGDTRDSQCAVSSAYTNIIAYRPWIRQAAGL
jgi:secreted trypsin-like serine protease